MPPASPPMTPERDHHPEKNPWQLDADRAAEAGIEPDESGAEPLDGESAPDSVRGNQREADEKAEVERGRRQETRQFGGRANQRGCGVGRSSRQQRPVDEPARQVDRDEVQHQRRHDFVDSEPRAQQARREQPRAADDRGGHESEGNEQQTGPGRKTVAGDRRDDAAEIEAAFGADIEHAGPERDGRGEPHQQQRRGFRQRGRDAPLAAESLLDHQPVDRNRLVTRSGPE